MTKNFTCDIKGSRRSANPTFGCYQIPRPEDTSDIRSSYSVTSMASGSRATDSDRSSVLLLPKASQPQSVPKYDRKQSGTTNGPTASTQRLSSTERSRVLRSTIKLRRILGESLDEEVVKQWVVLPKQRAHATSHHRRASLPSSSLDVDLEEQSNASSISIEDLSLEWQQDRLPWRHSDEAVHERPSVCSSKEKSITIRRTAKLYSMLGERVYAYSPNYHPSTVPVGSDSRCSSETESPRTGKDHRVGNVGLEKGSMDTVQRFIRGGLTIRKSSQ